MTETQTSQTTELIALSTLASSLEKLEPNREKAIQAAINSVTGIGLLAKNPSASIKAVESYLHLLIVVVDIYDFRFIRLS